MSANIIRVLPDPERALLECYVAGSKQDCRPSLRSRVQAEVPSHLERLLRVKITVIIDYRGQR